MYHLIAKYPLVFPFGIEYRMIDKAHSHILIITIYIFSRPGPTIVGKKSVETRPLTTAFNLAAAPAARGVNPPDPCSSTSIHELFCSLNLEA